MTVGRILAAGIAFTATFAAACTVGLLLVWWTAQTVT